jgi:hypothetical protein
MACSSQGVLQPQLQARGVVEGMATCCECRATLPVVYIPVKESLRHMGAQQTHLGVQGSEVGAGC